MNPARHKAVQALFEAACELPTAERSAFIERESGDDSELAALVRELVRLEELGSSALDRPAVSLSDAGAGEPSTNLPQSIGPYRIVRRLGAGGMGVVFECEQPGVERRVAVKLLRAELISQEMLRRFEIETRVLGRLSHVGIARILEAGTAELGRGPQPFFAMELVQGDRLLEHVRRKNLSLRERLVLFAEICDAVAHAHQKGVVHRDLKPSNILVDETGQPKILDFGVARVVDEGALDSSSLTRTGELLGTLAYMSPEQVGGDPGAVDTRCDVYALGVLAYEMLADRRPFDIGQIAIAEAVRIIAEVEPPPLSRHGRALAGDLSTIVGKALEKTAERRYRSVEELVGDVRHFLRDEPITARAPSVAYQVSKYARRHRALVLGVLGIIVALAAGVISTTRMYLRAETARARERELRREAEESAETLRATNAYFLGLLASPSPWEMGAEVKMRDVLAAAAQRSSGAFPDRPGQRLMLLETLGLTHLQLGLHAESLAFFDEALTLARAQPDLEASALANLLQKRAEAQRLLVDLDAAKAGVDEALALLQGREQAQEASARRNAETTLARILLDMGDGARAAQLAGAELQRLEAETSTATDRALLRELLARAQLALGDPAEAERLLRQSITELEESGLAQEPDALLCFNTLVSLLYSQKRIGEALPLMEHVLATMRLHAGDTHPIIATQTQNLATMMRAAGKLDRAEELYREALAQSRAGRTPPHFDIAAKLANLGSLLIDRGQRDEALRMLEEADAMFVQLSGERSASRVSVQTYLGVAFRRAGQLEVAREHLELALSLAREFVPPTSAELSYLLQEIAALETQTQHPEAAVEALDEVLRIRTQVSGERSLTVAFAARELALALCNAGRAEQGVELSRATLEIVSSDHAQVARALAQHRADHGWCLWLAGRRDEARPLLETSVAELSAAFGEQHEVTRRQRERVDSTR